MEPKPKSDNWVEKNYILVGDSDIARIFKDTMKYFGPQHISLANHGDKIENTLRMVNKYNLPGGCDVAIVHVTRGRLLKE